MTPLNLTVLFFVIPLTVTAVLCMPQRSKPFWLAAGGTALVLVTGGWKPLLLTALSVCFGWLTVRLLPDSRRAGRRTGLYAGAGIAVQLALLPAAVWLTGAPFLRLPLLLCVLQSIDCIRLRAKGQMHIPPLLPYFSYQLALPRLFGGPAEPFSAAQTRSRDRKVTLQRCGAGAMQLTSGILQSVLISVPLCIFRQEICENAAAVTAFDGWLKLLVTFLMLYYAVSGAIAIGRGTALLMGFQLPRAFRTPLAAASLQELAERTLPVLTGWCRRNLLRDGLPLADSAYFLRMMLFFCAAGLYFRPAVPALLWGVFTAAAMTAGRMLLRREIRLPRPAARWGVRLLLLLATGILQADTVTAIFSGTAALFGRSGILLSGPMRYLLRTHRIAFAAALLGLLPLSRAARHLLRTKKWAAAAAVLLVPVTELAVLLLGITFLLGQT